MNLRVHVGHARAFLRIAFCVVLSFLLAGCPPGQPPVAQPSGTGWTVNSVAAKVWASITAGVPKTLDSLAAGASAPLAANGYATCDNSGKARLTKTGCEVWVFKNSGLKTGTCTGSAGSWVCTVGTSLAKCIVNTMTASADIIIRGGTWVSVTALDGGRLTIVGVADGGADVVPATVLDGACRILEDHSMDCSFATRQMAEDQTVKLDVTHGTMYTYTAPDAYLAELRARYPSLPPPRQPLPLEQLPQLIQPLLEPFPELEPWMGDLYRQASSDNVFFPPMGALPGAVLHGGGGWLQDIGSQEAVLRGVDWPGVIGKAFGGKPVSVAVDMPNRQLPDAQGVPFDPAAAADAVKNMNPAMSNRVTVLAPTEDPELSNLAELVVSSLQQVGLAPEMVRMPASEMGTKATVMLAAGEPVLWISRP